jgi:hypothetical protein
VINLDLYLTTTFVLSALALLLVVWAFFTGKKLYHVYILKILILFLIVPLACVAQEEDIFVVDSRPLVIDIPDAVKSLDNGIKMGIDYLSEDEVWRLGIYNFLYGDMSFANETNSTNITA